MERPTSENIGRSLVALGGVLFALSMILPFSDLFGNGLPGFVFLIFAPVSLDRISSGEAIAFVAWLANPLCVIALYQAWRERPARAARVMAVALACVGVTMLFLQIQAEDYVSWEPLHYGAAVWAFSLVLVFAGSTIAGLADIGSRHQDAEKVKGRA